MLNKDAEVIGMYACQGGVDEFDKRELWVNGTYLEGTCSPIGGTTSEQYWEGLKTLKDSLENDYKDVPFVITEI